MPEEDPAVDPPPDRADQVGHEPAPDDRPGPGARPDDRPLLPDVTTDERDVGWGDPYEPDDDERFLRDVPPHHGH